MVGVRCGEPVAGAVEQFGVGGMQGLVVLERGIGQQRPE
jgi:hypothetical protein